MAHSIGQISKKYGYFQDISAIIVFLGFTLIFMFAHKFDKIAIKQEVIGTTIFVEKIPVTVIEKPVSKPERVYIPMPGDDGDEFLEEDGKVLNYGGLLDFKITDKPPVITFQGAMEEKEIVDFWVIEEKPKIIGGVASIYKHMKYPKMAKRSGVEGVVVLKFICSATGVPQNITIFQERPANMGFGEAAKKALANVRLKPGMQRDKAVAVRMTQQIKFRLK